MEKYADIILPLPLRSPLTYRIPSDYEGDLCEGRRVLVPLGRHKYYSGIVSRIHSECPETYSVKDILQVLDERPVVGKKQLDFWTWMADYYQSTLGEVMAAALPSGFRLESETSIAIDAEFSGEISSLMPREMEIIRIMAGQGRMTIRELGQKLGTTSVTVWVQRLMEKGVVAVYEEMNEKYRPRMESYVSLSPTYAEREDALAQVFDTLEKSVRTRKQLDVLLIFMTLQKKTQQKWIAKKQLLQCETVSESSLQTLVKKGVLCLQDVEVSRLESVVSETTADSICLTAVQEQALNSVYEQFELHPTVLLHGVTGSGKTEIFIKLIQETLAKGKQVLYLLPEIALTSQIITRLRRYFGTEVGVYHSRFSDQERVEIWDRVHSENSYGIVLGARSAIFLPFRDLGLIIVDEEHDASYKQSDPAPRYSARDAAIVLARMYGAKTLLGSATPSMESFYNAERGKYGLVSLKERYAGMELPVIQMADLRKEFKSNQGMAPYSQLLLNRIGEALENKEQVILFQNRRGFSLHLECEACHHIPMCRHCDVALTYHKSTNQLRCHYCGYAEAVPSACPQCLQPGLRMRGMGTEKIEEELSLFFPKARISRLDYDSTRSKSAYQKIISDFEQHRVDILVGTQMVTKGLDFDNVSTVGILNADNMLYYPDFRAYERAFQIMSQVSGRAGRKKKRGMVVIQTFNPQHPIFQWVERNDYEGMYIHLKNERQQFVFPPFCRLIKLTLKHKDHLILDRASTVLVGLLKRQFGNFVLGPAYPTIPRVKNFYMKDVLVKVSDPGLLKNTKICIRQAVDVLLTDPAYRSVTVSFDVDPY